MSTERNLFKPIELSGTKLSHRIALAPLTRHRAEDDRVPSDMMVEYYKQRASQPEGTLLITEATFPSKNAGLYLNTPGVWTKEQIAGWKKISDAVHEHKSSLYIQLWVLGRTASASLNKKEGVPYVAPSSLPAPKNYTTGESGNPQELTKEQIKQFVKDFAQGAKNSIEAGADGVEIHGAHGYLISQFLDPSINQRTDEYGGSIENRARFLFEVVDSVVDAIGADKTAIRLSPWMNTPVLTYDLSPIPQYSYVITELERRAQAGKRLSYLHVVEPRAFADFSDAPIVGDNDWVRLIWSGLLIRAGGLTRDESLRLTDKDDNLMVAWGRYYISNPDLPLKLKENKPLAPYHRETFYSNKEIKGYLVDL